MSTSNSILRQYQIIAGISGQMLTQARLNRWESVVALGQKYQKEVEGLRYIEPASGPDRLARKNLLTQILNDDANIRGLATPELSRLSSLLGNMKRQKAVLRAYNSSPSPNR